MPHIMDLTLSRDKPGPWGFRLQGGVDFEKALTVAFVNEGTFSYNSGLRTGDVIVRIGELEAALLTHKEAMDAIIQQGNAVKLSIQRGNVPVEPAPGTWRPEVQPVGGPAITPAGPDQVYTKTSLTIQPKPQEEHWDVKHNITARGFQPGVSGVPGGVHSVAAPTLPSTQGSGQAPAGFRSVSAPQTRPGGPAPSPAGPPQPQYCWICNKPISGVFLQVKGRPLHEECFKCTTCSVSLKNVGHFVLGDKLYCQVHAREAQNSIHGIASGQAAQPPSSGMPQGLAQNLAKLSIKQPAQPKPVGQVPPPPPPTAAPPADWARKLNSNTAGMAGNAEDFTKEFMKQLTEGTGV